MKYSLAPQMAGLWGIPDGFAALCLQNLLIVEPTPLSWLYRVRTPISAQKLNAHFGRLIFVADGEGFEPPVELPPQRFSRPPHSTALPTILNFLLTDLIPVNGGYFTLFFANCKYKN